MICYGPKSAVIRSSWLEKTTPIAAPSSDFSSWGGSSSASLVCLRLRCLDKTQRLCFDCALSSFLLPTEGSHCPPPSSTVASLVIPGAGEQVSGQVAHLANQDSPRAPDASTSLSASVMYLFGHYLPSKRINLAQTHCF